MGQKIQIPRSRIKNLLLPIVKIGNPVLRHKCGKLKSHAFQNIPLIRFLKQMIATMRAAQGVGLAANQVGAPLKVIVMECHSNKRYPKRGDFPLQVYVNPEIIRYSRQKAIDWEGCLSIPGFRGWVTRSKKITFRALALNGEKVQKTVSGFEARVIQHEVDHINGFFYVDRMKDLKAWMHLEEFKRRKLC